MRTARLTTLAVLAASAAAAALAVAPLASSATPASSLSPKLECVIDLGGGAFRAWWGWNNPDKVEVKLARDGSGSSNKFTPRLDPSPQPEVFAGGRQYAMFSTDVAKGVLVWHLNGRTSTAGLGGPRCAESVVKAASEEIELGAPVQAVLAGAKDGAPLAGHIVVFRAGEATAEAVTDEKGIATAKLELKPGTHELAIDFAGGPARSGASTVTKLSVAESDTAAVAAASPSLVTFPAREVGTVSATQPVAFANAGAVPLRISGIAVTGPFAAEGGTCAEGATLEPGAVCTLDITFVPSATGPLTGAVAFSHDAGGAPVTADLAGTGTLGVTVRANAGAAGGGWIVAPGLADREPNRQRIDFAYRSSLAGVVRGKVLTFRFRTADGQAYVLRGGAAVEATLLAGPGRATVVHHGTLSLVTPKGEVAVPDLHRFRIDIAGTGSGAGRDRFAIVVFAPSGTVLHRAGTPSAPLALAFGAAAAANPWLG